MILKIINLMISLQKILNKVKKKVTYIVIAYALFIASIFMIAMSVSLILAKFFSIPPEIALLCIGVMLLLFSYILMKK